MNQIRIGLVTALVIMLMHPLNAQNWLWAAGFTSSGCHGDDGTYIMMYPSGNLFCTGNYTAGCTIMADSNTLAGGGNNNAYLTSFNQNGSLLNITNLYAFSAVFTNYISFSGRPVTGDSGYIYSALNIVGPAMIGTISANGLSTGESILSKWNNAATCLWIKYFPSLANPVFNNGSLYALGSYNQDSVTVGNFTLYNANNKALAYVTKLDEEGNCRWVKQASGGNITFNYIHTVNNRVYICAQTDSCLSFDTINICNQKKGGGVGLLMQTDTNGVVQWRSAFSAATGASAAIGLSLDGSGNCYMLGRFDTTFQLGNNTLNKGVNDLFDIFIAKYDSLGNILWIKLINCPNQTYINSTFTDQGGYTYILGDIYGTTIFGSDTVIPQGGGMFVARYSPGGDCLGVITVANAGVGDIAEDSAGNAYITGSMGPSTTFGSTTLTGSANGDFFIAKLSAMTDSTTGFSVLAPYDNHLQIYSNPNQGLFNIVVPQGIVHANSGTLTIYNDMGSIILNSPEDLSSGHLEVDLGTISRGVYTVMLTANSKQYMGRVVIQ